jgi:hypothetical protein
LSNSVHILRMGNVYVAMPVVEVTAPDGSRELWAAALPHDEAEAAVRRVIPEGYRAKLTNERLPVSPRMEGFSSGEIRKVRP